MKNKKLIVILVSLVVLLCCCSGAAITGMVLYTNLPEESKLLPSPEDSENCVVAGCSGQLCIDKNSNNSGMTTCEWKDEYACYREAICEKQLLGCGWTYTKEYYNCMQNID